MIRRIIHIDQEACNGCGLCASACHENAIGMMNGKATLLRDDYCDGLGDCLPACPTGAITFEEREAADYNEAAVKENQQALAAAAAAAEAAAATNIAAVSQLHNWPIQIKLAPINAPIFTGAHLLIAADCTAYSRASFHQEFMAGKVTLIGCPKLDGVNYADKLTQIFAANNIQDITLTRMEVPCCGGLEFAVKNALEASGRDIPLNVVTISISGDILDESALH